MTNAETKTRPSEKKKLAILAFVVAVLSALLVVSGCSPAANSSQSNEATEDSPAISLEGTGYKDSDFQNRDSGALLDSDEYNIPAKVNMGNRGCDACHEDLQATVENYAPLVHIMTTGAIYGKTTDWNDCESCHSMHDTRGGVYLGDQMHSIHYSTATFTDQMNGNCWSCHATKKNGEIVMFDEFVYEDQMSGYIAYSDLSERFFAMRGYDADSSIGITTLAADEVDAEFTLDQATSPEEERYEAVNFAIPEWTDEDFANWTINITGVKNPQSFTLADLEANFEKVTKQVTQECLVNGVNSSLEDSFEASGYLLEDIIEYCGGVEGEATTVRAYAHEDEGWDFCVELDDALNNGSFIAVEYYGKELTAYMGAPAVLVNPGFPGGTWVKYLTDIHIGTDEVTAPIRIIGGDDFYDGAEDPHLYPNNAAWFSPSRDGQVYKVGEEIDLQGFAWVWSVDGHYTSAVRFSWDYGSSWITVPVADDADRLNWQRFYGTWTPTEPGVYCLKVEAVDGADEWHQKKPASVFITVEE